MQSGSYIDVRNFASLEPGTVAALAPYLAGRDLQHELVAIACDDNGPVHYFIRSLAELTHQDGCNRFEAELAPLSATALWLVGIADDLTEVAAGITGILETLDRYDLDHHTRLLSVHADGLSWGYAKEHVDDIDTTALRAVPAIDPTTGRLAALTVRAGCARRSDVTVLTPHEDDVEELLALQSKFEQLRGMAVSAAALEQADRYSLLGCIDCPGPITMAEAVNLGLALAASPSLFQTAVDRVLNAKDTASMCFDLWCQIARAVSGEARAVAAALAALAAWRCGSPFASSAIAQALEADPQSAQAWLVNDLLAYGADPGSIGASFAIDSADIAEEE